MATKGISWTIDEDNLTKLDKIETKLNRSQKLNKILAYILSQENDAILNILH